MICSRCKVQDHDRCDDKLHERLYRSCDCLHRVPERVEESSSDASQ